VCVVRCLPACVPALSPMAGSQTSDPIELLLCELTNLRSVGSNQQLSADSEALEQSVVVSMALQACAP
jgi:hypothetical protein